MLHEFHSIANDEMFSSSGMGVLYLALENMQLLDSQLWKKSSHPSALHLSHSCVTVSSSFTVHLDLGRCYHIMFPVSCVSNIRLPAAYITIMLA